MTITLQELLDAGFDPDDVLDSAQPLHPDDCPLPILVDDSGNLVDGYHRTLGILLWSRAASIDPTEVEIPAVAVPDWIGERLWGRGISDQLAGRYIRHFGRVR